MMFAQIPDPLLRKKLSEFRDYLPENRREQFTDLVVAAYLNGKDKGREDLAILAQLAYVFQ